MRVSSWATSLSLWLRAVPSCPGGGQLEPVLAKLLLESSAGLGQLGHCRLGGFQAFLGLSQPLLSSFDPPFELGHLCPEGLQLATSGHQPGG